MNLNKNLLYSLLLFTAFLSTSCGSLRKGNNLFQSEYDKFADTAKSVYVANPSVHQDTFYHIKPFDLVGVRNLQNPIGLVASSSATQTEATSIFRSDQYGNISLPVVGVVNINGLTTFSAAAKIQKIYGEKLLKNPIIEVIVVSRKVTLLGEVSKAGIYSIDTENFNLIDLIGRAGSFLPSANPKGIKIIRGDRKNPEIIYINLKDIRALSSDKLALQSEDIIYVPTRGIYSANEDLKSFSGLLQPGILILNALVLLYTISR